MADFDGPIFRQLVANCLSMSINPNFVCARDLSSIQSTNEIEEIYIKRDGLVWV